MNALQQNFVRRTILGFQAKLMKHREDRPDKGWKDAHDQFYSQLSQLETGLIAALQNEDPKGIRG
ncbi:MAG: hypothetical protein WCL08_04020 [Verrucomicrobiota bacterium]